MNVILKKTNQVINIRTQGEEGILARINVKRLKRLLRNTGMKCTNRLNSSTSVDFVVDGRKSVRTRVLLPHHFVELVIKHDFKLVMRQVRIGI